MLVQNSRANILGVLALDKIIYNAYVKLCRFSLVSGEDKLQCIV